MEGEAEAYSLPQGGVFISRTKSADGCSTFDSGGTTQDGRDGRGRRWTKAATSTRNEERGDGAGLAEGRDARACCGAEKVRSWRAMCHFVRNGSGRKSGNL